MPFKISSPFHRQFPTRINHPCNIIRNPTGNIIRRNHTLQPSCRTFSPHLIFRQSFIHIAVSFLCLLPRFQIPCFSCTTGFFPRFNSLLSRFPYFLFPLFLTFLRRTIPLSLSSNDFLPIRHFLLRHFLFRTISTFPIFRLLHSILHSTFRTLLILRLSLCHYRRYFSRRRYLDSHRRNLRPDQYYTHYPRQNTYFPFFHPSFSPCP